MKLVEFAEDRIGVGDGKANNHCVPNADIISLETVVNMMVNKKICTAEELFMLEGRVQELNQKDRNNNFVHVQNHLDRGKFPGLKRIMSKQRWSRQLGTILFGWKWKKVKRN